MIVFLDASNAIITNAQKPEMYRELPDPKSIDYVNGKPLPKGPFAIITNAMFPVFSRASLQRDLSDASISSCRTMLDIFTYRHRFGSYPDSLDALRKNLSVKIPVDPMSGKDFIYRRQNSGFILYSIGENMRDDGGRWVKKKFAAPNEMQYDDIVWKTSK